LQWFAFLEKTIPKRLKVKGIIGCIE
jgi:hypothetical protein